LLAAHLAEELGHVPVQSRNRQTQWPRGASKESALFSTFKNLFYKAN
jgi:hypothetical protein